MTPTELSRLSIAQASSGLRRKEFSPVELAQTCLKRIESLDGKLHSFITVTADLALEQARKAEHELENSQTVYSLPWNSLPTLATIPFGEEIDSKKD